MAQVIRTSGEVSYPQGRHHTRKSKADDELQIVWGEVYVPGFPDSQGDFMTTSEVRKAAHRWLAKGDLQFCIDVNHDGQSYNAHPVESFIARKGDPEGFLDGSWVVGVHVECPSLWGRIKKGELNGFSMEALVFSDQVEIDIDMPEQLGGLTMKSEGHQHIYKAWIDENGCITDGETDYVDGHRHTIKRGTITEESYGHRHRFSFLDNAPRMET